MFRSRKTYLTLAALAAIFAVPAYKVLQFQQAWGESGFSSEVTSTALILIGAAIALLLGEAMSRLLSRRPVWAIALGAVLAGPLAALVVAALLQALLNSQIEEQTNIWRNTWSVSLSARGRWLYVAVLVAAPVWFLFRVRSRQRSDA